MAAPALPAAATQATDKTNHPYIDCKLGVRAGKPIIVGTSIKVSDIVIYYEHMGWSGDEILQAYPHLTLAQIHAALAYYYDNSGQINDEIARDDRLVEAMKKSQSSVWEKKRAVADSHG